MKKLVITLLSVLLMAGCSQTQQAGNLKVLYVGQNPDTVEGYGYGGNPDYNNELQQTRASEFMGLLEQHFDATLVSGQS